MSAYQPEPTDVLIVDDELLARERLTRLLENRPGAKVVGKAVDGPEAAEVIETLEPDVVFLDVQMPGMNGIDVIDEVGREEMPVTVFVTAYDEYAVKAFELAAVDYLIKPFDDERFEEALGRAREKIDDRNPRGISERLFRLLWERAPSLLDGQQKAKGSHVERISVQGQGHARVVPVEKITHITAEGSYAELHTGGDTYAIREQMKKLETRLDPEAFVRVHRSAIVRIEEVEVIRRDGGGTYAVRLQNGQQVSVSRGRIEDLEDRLGVEVTQQYES